MVDGSTPEPPDELFVVGALITVLPPVDSSALELAISAFLELISSPDVDGAKEGVGVAVGATSGAVGVGVTVGATSGAVGVGVTFGLLLG
jgi:hypothetical protein